MRTRRKGRISAPKLPRGVRHLRRRSDQILLAGVEQHLTLQDQIACIVLLIVDVGVGLAVEKLSV